MNPVPKPIKRISAKKYRGLGDVVEAAVKPLARAIDRIAGTEIALCKGCAGRRDWLNETIPFKGP